MWYNYNKKRFRGRAKPIRIIGNSDNRRIHVKILAMCYTLMVFQCLPQTDKNVFHRIYILFMAWDLPAGIKRNGGLLHIGRIKIFRSDNENSIEGDF